MPYVVVAQWTAKEGQADRVAEVVATMAPLSRREPGCLQYDPYRSIEDPNRFVLYERYTDEDGFKAHLDSGHYQRYVVGVANDCLAQRSADRFTVPER